MKRFSERAHASLALNLSAITPPRRADTIMQIARGARNRANTRESDESVTEADARSGLCLIPLFNICKTHAPSDTLFNHRRIDPPRRTEDTIVLYVWTHGRVSLIQRSSRASVCSQSSLPRDPCFD